MSDTLLAAIIAAIPATVITIINFYMLLAARQASNAAKQALDAQVQITRAQVFSRIRDKWTELDRLMLENVHHFHKEPTPPVAPLVLPDGKPNPDPRLYIGLIIFGMVEEILTLRERGLAHESDLESYGPTISAIMAMPVAQDFWRVCRDAYPPHVQAYLDSLAASGNQPPRVLAEA